MFVVFKCIVFVCCYLLHSEHDHANFTERREGRLHVLASLEKLLNKEMYVTVLYRWFSASFRLGVIDGVNVVKETIWCL